MGKHKGALRIVPLAPPFILAAVTAALFVSGSATMSVPPMDDTYIHLVYGGSLLTGNPLDYNGSGPSSGFTSPLWLVPSALSSLGGREAAPMLIMGFSLLAACLLLLLLKFRTALLLMLSGPFLFHASSGMETALACLTVAAAWRWVRGSRKPVTGSLILLAAFLTRPELAVLAVPMAWAMERRTAGRMLGLIVPSVAAGAAWIAWNLHATGLPLPSTFYAKQAVSWPAAAGSGLPGLLKGLLLTSPLLLFAAASMIRGSLSGKGRNRQTAASALIPPVLLLTALYLQPNSHFQMRYYLPSITALALASGQWLRDLGARRRLNTAILALSLVPGAVVFAGRRVEASRDVTCIDCRPALYLHDCGRPGESVAAADIGAVGWFTDLGIVDLDGLVTPQRLPGPGREGWTFVRENADYLLAFPRQYSELVEAGGGDLVFLQGFGSPCNVICGEDSVALWRIE